MAQIDTLTNVGAVVSTDLALILRGGANVLGTLGSMVGQNSTAVTITGGTIDNTVIGGTTAAAGSFTTGTFSGAVTADAVAVNTTLKTWDASTDAIQLQSGSLWNYSTSQLNLGQNEYYNGVYKYLTTGAASTYNQASGGHFFKTAVSGSADGAIAWVDVLGLSSTGAATFSAGAVFNESGVDADFRVESDNDSSALFVDGADGTTTVRKLDLGVGGGLRGEGAISVGTSATNITSENDFGTLCIVSGNSGGAIFSDLVFFASTVGATVVTGGTVSGGPANRTYSVVASKLKLAMASGTYSVKATAFMGTL